MPQYGYTAYPLRGNTDASVAGQCDARNVSDVIQQLKAQSLVPIDIFEEEKTGNEGLSLKSADRVLFIRQLATLLGSSLPIDASLLHMRDQAPTPSIRKIAIELYRQIEEGSALSVAMRVFPRIFPRFYCETVSAGEVSGQLSVVLDQLADYTESQEALKKRVIQAITYPITVIGVALLIVSFLLYYVVPRIVGVFSQTGQTLPFITDVLMRISGFIQSYGVIIAVGAVVAFFIHKRFMRQEEYKYKVEILVSKLPLIGPMSDLFATTMFFRTFDILLRSGVPLLESLESATRVVEQMTLQEVLQVAQKNIKEGMTVYLALQQSNMFRPMALCLIASGENSGNLVPMIHRVADVQQMEFDNAIKNALTILEPVMILIMGAMILFIVLAVLLPIFSMDAQ
jgi:general secretion pathway protein F